MSKRVVMYVLAGWLLSIVISPQAILGMVRPRSQ